MIRSVAIKRLRGIKTGLIENLTPLTVLVGPNSSGKSTILDALLIAASSNVGDAVGRAVRHRETAYNGGRWLLWKAGDEGPAVVRATSVDNNNNDWTRNCSIAVKQSGVSHDGVVRTDLGTSVGLGALQGVATTRFTPDNNCEEIPNGTASGIQLPGVSEVRFVEPWTTGVVAQLVELYSEAKRQGRGDAVLDVAKDLIPGFRTLEVLAEAGRSLLHVDRGNMSLQLGLEGDGLQSLLRLAIEMAARPGGVVLLEEPETHQHPRTLVSTAQVIAAAVRRGLQVVLSTHSIELIDALVAALGPDEAELAKLSVVSLRLDDGKLISSRLDGEQVARSRENIAMELR